MKFLKIGQNVFYPNPELVKIGCPTISSENNGHQAPNIFG
jgi:hypothetical protein